MRATPKPAIEPPQTETVTLEKIGDFLELDLRRISVWLRASLRWIAALAVLGAIAGAAYGVFSKPSFTVTSDILIDPAGLQVLSNDAAATTNQPAPDTALLAAASKLRVMTSGNVLGRVVSDLRTIGQMGTMIGIGLLFDTLIVRSFMVPSIAALLGRWFWWPLNPRTRPLPQPRTSLTA